MNTKESVAVVKQFFKEIENGDLESGLRNTTDDFTWWVVGTGEVQDQIAAVGKAMAKHMKKPMTMTVHGITADGNRVAVEAESYGELKNGDVYNNKYHFLFIVEDGKIKALKEYADTKHASEVLGFLMA